MKTSYPIEYHAMCRECSKEFGANPLTVDQMNKAMNEHVKNNSGHIIVGDHVLQARPFQTMPVPFVVYPNLPWGRRSRVLCDGWIF